MPTPTRTSPSDAPAYDPRNPLIVQSDRTLNPHAWELTKVYQPIAFRQAGAGKVEVINRHDFVSLAGFDFRWRLEADGALVASGDLAVPDIAARERAGVRAVERARVVVEVALLARLVRRHAELAERARRQRGVAEQIEQKVEELEIQIPPGKRLGDRVIDAVNLGKS